MMMITIIVIIVIIMIVIMIYVSFSLSLLIPFDIHTASPLDGRYALEGDGSRTSPFHAPDKPQPELSSTRGRYVRCSTYCTILYTTYILYSYSMPSRLSPLRFD
jgi:hypothetical protein